MVLRASSAAKVEFLGQFLGADLKSPLVEAFFLHIVQMQAVVVRGGKRKKIKNKGKIKKIEER